MTWVLLLTMPSGNQYILGEYPGKEGLCLFPVKENVETLVKGAFGFKTEQDALKWIEATRSMSDQGAKLMKLTKPFLSNGLIN